jgi:FkbH-like protein
MSLHADLAWLPVAPNDFNTQLRSALDAGTALGPELRRLATHRLNGNQLSKLAKALASARAEAKSIAPLAPFRLGLLSNATTGLVSPALVGTALRYGIALDVVEAPFNQVAQVALQPHSILAASRLDAVLLAIDVRGIPLVPAPGDREAAEKNVEAALHYVRTIRNGLRGQLGASLILQTVARLPEPLFGSFDFRLPGTARWLVDRFNRILADDLGDEELLLDVASIAETVGLENWHNPTQWNLAKLSFAQDLVPLYADHVCRLIGALRGKSRRCLVLDLDNTLWGGVIGDDGVEGIVLGQDGGTGEAHLSVQRGALALRERGIVLAVSSKNDDAVARRPFREHADMVMKEDHFGVFQANWTDKAANMQAIADALALGADSLVFLDDNPAERLQVRGVIPSVAVPELPPDPALYIQSLLASGYFEAVSFSGDDRNRATFYRDNARRVALKEQAGDLDAYLASLDMTITFQPFDAIGRSRIAQLVAKSNQFNLTTRRYSEAQIAEMESSPAHFTLQVRLADTFGDNGMISVVICRKNDAEWEFDTWLMSCRVLGRGVEESVLQEVERTARQAGVQSLKGRFIPTDRNAMVADHYAKLGFELAERLADGETIWRYRIGKTERPKVPMKISRLP